ncbi:methylated-DNA--[protein]-cysteine S-methyltransferase [Desulfosarcina sp. OttesenSCG-928-A07]|nr:methylated-DNA--[protein]-cysteine S-methyltransferase [Desulfosarcina sp. OttesenSCG-928-G17]MDL2328790.1 methylated-DNA--[protein]-cysteine S-methyltransferase [Desulfosarcina sp. OttesenSCG-928-A07]
MFYSTCYASPLGAITLASDGDSIVGLWNHGQKYFAATVKENLVEKPDLPVLIKAKNWLDAYFAGNKPEISDLPLDPAGSEFRKVVWDILCEIPYGACTTYGEIAKKMAIRMNRKTMSGQAVGGAVGHNPISIIIPCHRVVGSNGSLTGYAGGIDIKIKLLELEGVDTSRFFIPKTGSEHCATHHCTNTMAQYRREFSLL